MKTFSSLSPSLLLNTCIILPASRPRPPFPSPASSSISSSSSMSRPSYSKALKNKTKTEKKSAVSLCAVSLCGCGCCRNCCNKPDLIDGFIAGVLQPEVDHCVLECSAHVELQRQIVHSLVM